jgi:hypothetical protein
MISKVCGPLMPVRIMTFRKYYRQSLCIKRYKSSNWSLAENTNHEMSRVKVIKCTKEMRDTILFQDTRPMENAVSENKITFFNCGLLITKLFSFQTTAMVTTNENM